MNAEKPIQLDYVCRGSLQRTLRPRAWRISHTVSSKRALRLYMSLLAMIVGLGYISNFLSQRAAENETASNMVWYDFGDQGYPIFWADNATSVEIFKRIGSPRQRRRPFGGPWRLMEVDQGQISVPFVCAVHHVMWLGQGKHEGDDLYLCLFGRTWVLRDTNEHIYPYLFTASCALFLIRLGRLL